MFKPIKESVDIDIKISSEKISEMKKNLISDYQKLMAEIKEEYEDALKQCNIVFNQLTNIDKAAQNVEYWGISRQMEHLIHRFRKESASLEAVDKERMFLAMK